MRSDKSPTHKRIIRRLRVCRYPQALAPSNLFSMQRLFSAFPPGWPGIGLLLLRISVAAGLLAHIQCETRAAWVLPTVIPMTACLCAGALTPLAAVLAVALELTAARSLRVNGAGLLVITIIDAAALALLGPGAYSLDALRFGRRVILAQSWRDGGSE